MDNWVFYVWVGLVGIFLPALFPTGRLPSRHWRPVVRLEAGLVAIGLMGTAFGSRRIEWGTGQTVANPFVVEGPLGRALAAAAGAAGSLLALVVLAALAGLVLRLRRSAGIERQQLKWFAYALGLVLVSLVAAAVRKMASVLAPLGNVGWFLFIGALLLGLPLAIGLAVMRHRLYDIDVVISRTLVYGALTVTLAAAHLGSVLLLQLVFQPLASDSGLAIAGSTLAVAALFGPARARIQALVDRRFYRRRYDAARTLEVFGSRLRDELDLEALSGDLRAVVRDTVQPAHVSDWLRAAVTVPGRSPVNVRLSTTVEEDRR